MQVEESFSCINKVLETGTSSTYIVVRQGLLPSASARCASLQTPRLPLVVGTFITKQNLRTYPAIFTSPELPPEHSKTIGPRLDRPRGCPRRVRPRGAIVRRHVIGLGRDVSTGPRAAQADVTVAGVAVLLRPGAQPAGRRECDWDLSSGGQSGWVFNVVSGPPLEIPDFTLFTILVFSYLLPDIDQFASKRDAK